MGVYIRGMEMPKNCWEFHFGHGDSGACVVDFKQHGDWDEPKNCPLAPVPPHGRLIDADALNVIGYCGIPQGSEDTFDDGVMWLAKQIDLLPTIIEAEEGE